MLKRNDFHQRQILFAKLNDMEAKIPIIVAATAEELSLPENHFLMNENEKQLSRLQLFAKKGKMYGYSNGKPITKITGLANHNITIFGKPQEISPVSVMQNEKFFSALNETANTYLERVLTVPTKENQNQTYLHKMVNQLYRVIKNACPTKDEVIHLATMERDLFEPNANKNRLTAEFSKLLLAEIRKKIDQNNDLWQVKLDRILAIKHRTSRAESYGIHRIAQQPLMLYQARNIEENITPKEKVIIVDDHIQVGASIACSVDEVMKKQANLLSIVCITAHKNNQYFNIQPDVKEFIISLLPNRSEDLPRLNEILKNVGLSIDTLTNIEGMILISLFCDAHHTEHKSVFQRLLKKYDASADINYSLFQNQKNSLMEEFEKTKIEFENFESELLDAIHKGRYTVPYKKQIVLSDEEGQNIRKEIDKRSDLPWLLFDFDDTLHDLNNNGFIMFQSIIKRYSGAEVSLEIIKKTRQMLKESGQYQYQQMLLFFIKQHNPCSQISCEEITNAYQEYKNAEPFIPKMSKEYFLILRNKYRIGIITDGSSFEYKVPKIKAYYGVDIDGYMHPEKDLPKKPDMAMLKEFYKIYNIKDKPIAYVGDNDDLDGAMARNANLNFIYVDPTQPTIDMEKFTKELNALEEQRTLIRKKLEEQRTLIRKKWESLINAIIQKTKIEKIAGQNLLSSKTDTSAAVIASISNT